LPWALDTLATTLYRPRASAKIFQEGGNGKRPKIAKMTEK